MNKSLKKLFSCLIPKKLFYSVLSPKMVRYFPNTFEDHKPGLNLEINKDDINTQITEHINIITKRLQPSRKHVDGGLYVGVTGVAYMFYHLYKNPILSSKKSEYLEQALNYLKPALEQTAGDKTSFLLGDAGTYALATVLFNEMGNDQSVATLDSYKGLYMNYLNPRFLRCGGDEFFVGRAGYLAGAIWLSRELKTPIFSNEQLHKICYMIVTSGRDFAKKHRSPCPLMYHYYDTQYLGAAHGISFILQMLITVPGYLETDESVAKDIKDTIEFIASLQTEEGNWPCCMEEIGLSDHKLVHWCHGAPGMIYLMARAYLVFKNQLYLVACLKAGEVVWQKGLLRKGPGICHGVAGNAYVFLLLYRLTGEEKYLHRAKIFANFMSSEEFHKEARVPDNPETLYEGTAGTVCFLADLLMPDKAEFPFQNVFSN